MRLSGDRVGIGDGAWPPVRNSSSTIMSLSGVDTTHSAKWVQNMQRTFDIQHSARNIYPRTRSQRLSFITAQGQQSMSSLDALHAAPKSTRLTYQIACKSLSPAVCHVV